MDEILPFLIFVGGSYAALVSTSIMLAAIDQRRRKRRKTR